MHNRLYFNEIGFNGPTSYLSPKTGTVFGDFYDTNTVTHSSFFDLNASEFSGNGFVPWEVSTYTPESQTTSGGTFVYTKNADANLYVQVIYDYSGNGSLAVSSVPEPSAGILLGMGGLLCLVWRRKVALKV